MTILQAVILGIVEGVTEFLPISSTGHLILFGKLLGVADTDFTKSFEIAIQFGAILAVVVLYWKKFLTGGDVWKKVFTAFLPTAVVGFLLYKVLKSYLLGNAVLVVWALALGGIALIAFEIWHQKNSYKSNGRENLKSNEITYQNSFFVGLAQALAIIPGVSRSGATIIGGLLMGINRQTIVEFSFLLAVPTMAAATAYDLYKSAGNFSFGEFHVLAVGFIVSFVIAVLSIKWLLYFVKNHTFISFGVYRIVIALLFWLFIVR